MPIDPLEPKVKITKKQIEDLKQEIRELFPAYQLFDGTYRIDRVLPSLDHSPARCSQRRLYAGFRLDPPILSRRFAKIRGHGKQLGVKNKLSIEP